MPFPLLASLFLLAAGTGANALAQQKANSARQNATQAERIRQMALDREAQALNTQSQDRFQDFGAKQDMKAKTLGDYFVKESTGPDPNASAGSVMPTSTSSIVLGEQGRQMADASAFTGQQGRALGDLRAFGDLLGDTSRLQGRDASLIDQIGGFKKGSASILPYELDAAAQKGGGLRMLGDILGMAGSIGSGMGGGIPGLEAAIPGGPALGAIGAAKGLRRGVNAGRAGGLASLLANTRLLG